MPPPFSPTLPPQPPGMPEVPEPHNRARASMLPGAASSMPNLQRSVGRGAAESGTGAGAGGVHPGAGSVQMQSQWPVSGAGAPSGKASSAGQGARLGHLTRGLWAQLRKFAPTASTGPRGEAAAQTARLGEAEVVAKASLAPETGLHRGSQRPIDAGAAPATKTASFLSGPMVAVPALASLTGAATAYGISSGLGWPPSGAGAAGAGVGAALGAVLATLATVRLKRASAKALPAAPEVQNTLPQLPGEADHASALSREMFMELVGREWARSRRYGTGAALLLVEIDRYSRLVNTLGHDAGEQVLAALQRRVAQTLRGADAVARFENGQMAVFLAHADVLGALDVAERIREGALKFEVSLATRRVRFTVSLGVAHLRPAHLQLQDLVQDACAAVLASRAAGGNCVRAAPIEQPTAPTMPAARPAGPLGPSGSSGPHGGSGRSGPSDPAGRNGEPPAPRGR